MKFRQISHVISGFPKKLAIMNFSNKFFETIWFCSALVALAKFPDWQSFVHNSAQTCKTSVKLRGKNNVARTLLFNGAASSLNNT